MTLTDAQIWLVIAVLGAGTFLIRFSFLGLIGARPMPAWLLRLLRYTPVAVIPGMVMPLVLWPGATGGETDLPRLLAAVATLAAGLWTRSFVMSVGIGAVVLYAGLGLRAFL
jgi:branched-subunit amino acid transport protein